MLLDRKQQLLAINDYGRKELGIDGGVEGRRPGDVINCVVARRQARGCGHSEQCPGCALWQSLELGRRGETIPQREFSLEVEAKESTARKVFLTSIGPASGPLARGGGEVIVILQDITLLHRLSGLIPICAKCKNVRSLDEEWEAVEVYIEAHSHALFSHTFCPDCLQEYYREMDASYPTGSG